MRKILCAMAAAAALVMALPMATADAATVHVLTIRKTGGTAVKPGAVLKAGLVTGTRAVFALKGETLKCKSSRFAATLRSNPAAPGTARESLTSQTFAKCRVNVTGVTVSSVKVLNLPYTAKVSDATGLPVTVSGVSKARPLKVRVVVKAGMLTVSCTYSAAHITGRASNTGNVVAFSKQKFTKSAGSILCKKVAFFSAKYGPVRDVSVTGSPRVFVN